MNESKLTCNVCGEREFTAKEGYYYCNECGTQSKDVRDVVFEQEDNDGKTYCPNVTRIQTLSSDSNELTSWECFNYLLRGLVEELIELGAKKELKKVTLQLWTHYLRKTEAAFFSKKQSELPKLGIKYSPRDAKLLYNRKRVKRVQKKKSTGSSNARVQKRKFMLNEYEKLALSEQLSSSNQTSTQRSFSSSSQATTDAVQLSFTRVARKYYKKKMSLAHLKKHELDHNSELTCHSNLHMAPKFYNSKNSELHLSRSIIYTILYIALNLTESEIQLSDMLRFMYEGHISSSNIMHFFPDELAFSSEDLIKSRLFYSSRDVFLDHTLRISTVTVCRFLNVNEMKVPNLYNLVYRYVCDLNLPKDIVIFVNRLMNLCPVQNIRFNPKYNNSPVYEARAMAFIIFVLKLLFGLDDKKEVIISESARNLNIELEKLKDINGQKRIFVWDDWVKFIEMRNIILSQCHLPSAIRLNSILNQDQYLDQYCAEEKIEENRKLNLKRKVRIHNMQSIFECFQERNQKDSKTKITDMKFPPSLTPNRSYLTEIMKILPENLFIPEFMYIDHSQFDINCYVRVKELKNVFNSAQIKLNVKKISCKSERNYIGVFKNFDLLKTRKRFPIIVRRVSHDISNDEWIENIKEINKKKNIIECSMEKAKSQPVQLKKTVRISNLNKTCNKKKFLKDVFDLSVEVGEISEQMSIKSLDIFSELDMEPYSQNLFRQPRRNLDVCSIFDGMSDNDDSNSDDDGNKTNKSNANITQKEKNNAKINLDFNVSNFDYWSIFGKCRYLNEKQLKEIKKMFPKNFLWLIETCANTLGIDWNYLFKELIVIENYFINVLEPFDHNATVLKFQDNTSVPENFQNIVNEYKDLW